MNTFTNISRRFAPRGALLLAAAALSFGALVPPAAEAMIHRLCNCAPPNVAASFHAPRPQGITTSDFAARADRYFNKTLFFG